MDDFKFGIYTVDSSGNIGGAEFFGQLKEQNSYFFDMDRSLDGIYSFVFGNGLGSFVLPLNIELYDYYLVGTLYFNGQNNGVESFDVYSLFYEFLDDSGNFCTEDFKSFNTMEFQNMSEGYGKSFYGKIGLSDFSNLSTFRMSVNVNGSFFDDAWFSASIVPVEKSAGTDAATAAIIQKLTEINTNQTSSNVLQQESNQIAQDTQNQIVQGNEIAQDQLEVEQEQAETTKSIFEKITDFFGSFFENLINAVIGLFVPGEEEMAELFNQLNDFFADKFGFLYYPFELLTKVFNVLMTDSTTTAMTFPGITVLGYELCPAMEIDIAQNELVGDIFGHIRMITGGTMCFAFVNYLRTKFDKTVKS